MAKYAPDGEQWSQIQDAVGNDLVSVPTVFVATWMDAFRTVRKRLLAALTTVYRDVARRDTERSLATEILADYASDQPQTLADLAMDADGIQFGVIYPRLQELGAAVAPLLAREIGRAQRGGTNLGRWLPKNDG